MRSITAAELSLRYFSNTGSNLSRTARSNTFSTLAPSTGAIGAVLRTWGAGSGSSGMELNVSSIALRVWSEKMSECGAGATFSNTISSAGKGCGIGSSTSWVSSSTSSWTKGAGAGAGGGAKAAGAGTAGAASAAGAGV